MSIAQKLAKTEMKLEQKRLAKLTKRHAALLGPGENLLAELKAVNMDEPQPPMFFTAGIGGLLGLLVGRAWDRAKARDRAAHAQEQFGYPLSRFPKSKNGYWITTTQTRVIVFDGSGKKFVSEAALAGMDLVAVDHGKDMSTLIFTNGTEGLGFAHIRGAHVTADVFMHGFQHRRTTGTTTMPANPVPAAVQPAAAVPAAAQPAAPVPAAVQPAAPVPAAVQPVAPVPAADPPAAPVPAAAVVPDEPLSSGSLVAAMRRQLAAPAPHAAPGPAVTGVLEF